MWYDRACIPRNVYFSVDILLIIKLLLSQNDFTASHKFSIAVLNKI